MGLAMYNQQDELIHPTLEIKSINSSNCLYLSSMSPVFPSNT